MDETKQLFPRHLAPVVETALADTPVVCLLGPRQSGKTTLARQLAPQWVAPQGGFFSFDDPGYQRTAAADPSGFVAGLPDKCILDEVQRVPGLLPAIKLAVDGDRRPGRFLLTGSANLLLLPDVTESLAGRMEIVQLHPLTEAEKARNPGGFVAALLSAALKPRMAARQSPAGPTLPERLAAGGYPEPLTRSPARARQWHRQYLRSIIERDVADMARIKDADQMARLLELLALRSGRLLSISTLANELGLHRESVESYFAVLERLFLVRRLRPWHRNEAKRLIKSPKSHLLDTGLAATLAGLTADSWLTDRHRMGFLLESFVVQQLVAQAAWTDPELRFWHYRDKDQVEVDVVMTKASKVWGIEVKSAMSPGAGDGKGLARLANVCGDDFQQGILLYAGADLLPLPDKRMIAVPLSALWER